MKDMHLHLARVLAAALALTLCLGGFARAELPEGGTGTCSAPGASGSVPDSSLKDDGRLRVRLASLGRISRLDVAFAGVYAANGDPGFRFARGAQAAFIAAQDSVYLRAGALTLRLGPTVTLTRHAAGAGEENGLYLAQSESRNLYCGDLALRAEGGLLDCVLTLPVEEYLYGVVGWEMSDAFPLEALKAQAVAARSYAMRRKQGAGEREYDVVDTTADQVFKGFDPALTNVIAAVDATRGVVGTADGGFARCCYTASNGGQTALPSQVWGGEGDDACLAVKDDPYDLENPRSLENSVSFLPDLSDCPALKAMLTDALGGAMRALGYPAETWALDSVAAVQPVNPRTEGSLWYDGLAFDVNLRAAGESPSMEPPAGPVRVTLDVYGQIKPGLRLGLNRRDCELISVETRDDPRRFTLTMRRYGHGVGMSQRGAQWMAGHYGMGWLDILGFYYPGMRFERVAWAEEPLAELEPLPAGLLEPGAGERLARVTLSGRDATLNVREAPSLHARVVAALPNGREVLVTGDPDKQGWLPIRTGEVEGYVKGEYINRQ